MKIYGYDDLGPMRGEMIAAHVTSSQLDFGLESVAHELGWEKAFTSFAEAKKELMKAMKADDADDDLVRTARDYRASDIPVVEDCR